MVISLTSEFKKWNLGVWLQMFWIVRVFIESIKLNGWDGDVAGWHNNKRQCQVITRCVRLFMLTDNLIKQLRCLEIRLCMQSKSVSTARWLKWEGIKSFFFLLLIKHASHLLIYTHSRALWVWQVLVREKKKVKPKKRGENSRDSR